MRALARFSSRHARAILLVWVLVFVAALVFAPSARRHIRTTNLEIPGTEAARAASLTQKQFGGTIAIAILLEGPSRTLDRRGPTVVRRLQEIPGVEVLSPWATNGAKVLREPAGQALLTLQVSRSLDQISDQTTPAVQRVLDRYVRPPLRSQMTGLAPVMRALNETSLNSLGKGELIALPILFVMLLVIFRSPLAALVPALGGLVVTRIGTVLMGAIGAHIEVDALALDTVTMIGLALGVDYSLLMVSRFREELQAGASVPAAVAEVTARAGRTVMFAGTALSLGMVGAVLVVPGALLVSAAVGVIVAAVVAVSVALLAMPAGLTLLGHGVNRWRFGRAGVANPWVALAERALRTPGAAAFFVLVALLALASPVAALATGAPSVDNLPASNPARRAYEAFERERGGGWSAPYEIDLKTPGPITSEGDLRILQDFQRRLSGLAGVQAVLGPAALLSGSSALRQSVTQASAGMAKLTGFEGSLRRLTSGTASLREGLNAGSEGAQALAGGLGEASRGAARLATGARAAVPRSARFAHDTLLTERGAAHIDGALNGARSPTRKLRSQLGRLSRSLSQQNHDATGLTAPLSSAQSAAEAALRSLGSASTGTQEEPDVLLAKRQLTQALEHLGRAQTHVGAYSTAIDEDAVVAGQLAAKSKTLARAIPRLADASGRLDRALTRIATAADTLSVGVDRLSAGSARLRSGLRALLEGHGGGAKALAAGLRRALAGSRSVDDAAHAGLRDVVAVRAGDASRQAAVAATGTNLDRALASGYFVLAGIQGTDAQSQDNASFAINTANGGDTARVIVVPAQGPFKGTDTSLVDSLRQETGLVAHRLGGAQGLVGGPAVLLANFDAQMTGRLPILLMTLVLITFVVLLVVFRSPVLALCSVISNLVSVGAAVGVLIICFEGSSPLLGGPGYLDAISLSGIFAIIFGLSIDYEVFLLSRLVEGRARGQSTTEAIHYSLRKTATIITGAALVMSGVFIAFAISPVVNTRQFGIGLTVAVLIDATAIRLILIPALIGLFGERTWWIPAWLDRVLPHLSAPDRGRSF